MRITHHLAFAVVASLAVAACADRAAGPSPETDPGALFHVGYKGPDVPLGFVNNDAECHVGKKGGRWPASEQWEVKVYDAQLVVAPSGVIMLTCQATMPATKLNGEPLVPPEQAEVEQGVLCFLPGGIETRHAQEVFTPSGMAILTCHYNPNGR